MANLVVCLDGTWSDEAGPEPQTNVAIMAGLIDPRPANGVSQIVYYDAGVGTGGWLDHWAGGLFGSGLSANVLEAYRFLSLNYTPGDNVYVFGFSRGAYTARSLCGFLSASGLLRAEHCDVETQRFAWRYYRTRPKKRYPADRTKLAAKGYDDLRVRFLGVYDTVGALGIPRGWLSWRRRRSFQFHDTEVSSIVDHSCHALAIDERRAEFEAAVWSTPRHRSYHTVEQVWFPGVHANVGGGYDDRGLSDLSLDWMLKRLARLCPELALRPVKLAPDHAGKLYDSCSWVFWRSRLRPLIRLINRCRPGGDARAFRCARVEPHSRPIGEMVHWSALLRHFERRHHPVKERYSPINLLAALESATRGGTLVVGPDGEPARDIAQAGPDIDRPPNPDGTEARLH
jgi:T6SS, Phospholipase effector Tle1-like, catalytic domain